MVGCCIAVQAVQRSAGAAGLAGTKPAPPTWGPYAWLLRSPGHTDVSKSRASEEGLFNVLVLRKCGLSPSSPLGDCLSETKLEPSNIIRAKVLRDLGDDIMLIFSVPIAEIPIFSIKIGDFWIRIAKNNKILRMKPQNAKLFDEI